MEMYIGQILIAAPSLLNDPSFSQAVVLLAHADMQTVMGFITNKPLPIFLSDLMRNSEISMHSDLLVYQGGPVESDRLFFIHRLADEISGSVAIGSTGLYLGGDLYDAVKLINQGVANSQNIRFFLGYTGWSGFQLKKEMRSKFWFMQSADVPRIFEGKDRKLWPECIRKLPEEYHIWANAPEVIQMN